MPDRITVVEAVYFEGSGQEPISWHTNGSRLVTEPEQAYQRRIKVGPDWTTLDLGWIAAPGMILIRHERPRYPVVLPSQEQRAEDEARMILVRSSPQEAGWRVPVGESFRGSPVDPSQLEIRCDSGETFITFVILPK